jgi:hypothetical protein
MRVTGQARATAITIGGDLFLQGATLTNEGGEALSLDDAEIKRSAFLNPVTVTGQVRAIAITIGGELNLSGANVINKGGEALILDGADIKADLLLDAVTVTGSVYARRATVGRLSLQGARLTNEGCGALILDSADIKGDALLNSVSVTGQVSAIAITIGGELNLSDANVINKGGEALVLESADIKGDALLLAVTVTGEVWVRRATVGRLGLQEARLTNEDGVAMSLDGADIKGGAFLNPVTVTGEVRAIAANIGGQLLLVGGTLSNEGGFVLVLESARLSHLALMPAEVKGTIALEAAEISVLTTPNSEERMKVLIGSTLSASGWRLGDVRGLIRHDRKAAADWLNRESTEEFAPQPWHELANFYERNGQPADARWMRRKAAQGVTRNSPWWLKPIRWLYGGLTGHGYSPLRAAGWLILAIVASGVIVATNSTVFTPTTANKAALKTPPSAGQPAPPITGATPCEDLQDRSSCMNPTLYAFDNALPGTLATGQAAQWTANGAQGWNMWIPYTLGGLKIASWILVALLLAGVTGLLRKT